MAKARRARKEEAKHAGDATQAEKADVVGKERRTNPSRRQPQTILEHAQQLIYGERNKVYKHPNENFANIANLWNAYFTAILGRPDVSSTLSVEGKFRVNQIDVAYMNILQKVARGATAQTHLDTVVDVAGYAGCIERIILGK